MEKDELAEMWSRVCEWNELPLILHYEPVGVAGLDPQNDPVYPKPKVLCFFKQGKPVIPKPPPGLYPRA